MTDDFEKTRLRPTADEQPPAPTQEPTEALTEPIAEPVAEEATQVLPEQSAQVTHQQSYPQQPGYPPQAYPQENNPQQQGYAQQQTYPQQPGYPPQAYPQQGMQQQAYTQQQSYPPHSGYVQQGYQQQYPQGGYQQGYPPQPGYPPHQAAPMPPKKSSDSQTWLIVGFGVVLLALIGVVVWALFFRSPATPITPVRTPVTVAPVKPTGGQQPTEKPQTQAPQTQAPATPVQTGTGTVPSLKDRPFSSFKAPASVGTFKLINADKSSMVYLADAGFLTLTASVDTLENATQYLKNPKNLGGATCGQGLLGPACYAEIKGALLDLTYLGKGVTVADLEAFVVEFAKNA